LLNHYLEALTDSGETPAADFAEIYDLCAMQRLMQALGAYGFLGHVKERAHFLEHIPAALESLREVLGRVPGLDGLRAHLAGL
jgi:N-acetylmuramate 1-kinase